MTPASSVEQLAERQYFNAQQIKKVKQQQGLNELDDTRITEIRPLLSPQILIEEVPASAVATQTIQAARKSAEAIIQGTDDRLVVIVGPCSIHDVKAAIEYANKLKDLVVKLSKDLLIIMRVYFEKPRTVVGWKGLISDIYMDGSFQINTGLRVGRSLLAEINNLGVPCGNEMLDTLSPQYIADLISWAAIGARTTESQVHRELASGLSCPVGFKNGTEGTIQVAVDAIRASKEPHQFLSVTKQGISAIVCTAGNPATHVILRGGNKGTNYDADSVKEVASLLQKYNLPQRVMIDCSHGNSSKDYKKQALVVQSICDQLQSGSKFISGVMLESNLVEGRQNISDATGPRGEGLVYGKSITDACVGWDETCKLLDQLAAAVRARRSAQK